MSTYGQLMEEIRAFHENSTVVFHTNKEGNISSDDSVGSGSASGVSDQALSNMGHSGLLGEETQEHVHSQDVNMQPSKRLKISAHPLRRNVGIAVLGDCAIVKDVFGNK